MSRHNEASSSAGPSIAPTPITRSRNPSTNTTRRTTLRLPNASRNVSNPHVSLVFAHGTADPSALQSTSEETLSRQLDGDYGGRQMGLRSRTGSSATVGSMRTTGTPMVSPPLSSQVDGGIDPLGAGTAGMMGGTNEAGPSRRPSWTNGVSEDVFAFDDDKPPERVSRAARRLVNPKTSSSWLRWNSPARSFPRSISPGSTKGKGKAIMEVEEMKDPPDGQTPRVRPGSKNGSAVSTPAGETRAPPSDPPASLLEPATAESPPPEGTIATTPTPARRGWFGWSSSPAPAPPSVPPPHRAPDPPATVLVPPTPVSPSPSPLPLSIAAVDVIPNPKESLKETSASSPRNDVKLNGGLPAFVEQETVSWGAYLGWRSHAKDEPSQASTQPAALVPSQDSPTTSSQLSVPGDDAEHVASEPITPGPASSSVSPPIVPLDKAPMQNGWSTYLYPFYNPPKLSSLEEPPSKHNGSADVHPTRVNQNAATVPITPTPSVQTLKPPPTLAQPIQPSPTPTPKQPVLNGSAASDLPVPEASSLPRVESTPNLPLPSSQTTLPRKESNASTSWLNYLAFRASQKTITNPSTASVKSGREKKTPDVGEEVMDFSSDPNFPAVDSSGGKDLKPTTGNLAKDNQTKTGDALSGANGGGKNPETFVKDGLKTPSAAEKKAAQGLGIRPRKMSNSSNRSAGSSTAIPSSPKPPSTIKTPNVISKSQSKSALPPPPAPPSAQPNLVIPSFTTTFDRPPRSFPPLHSEASAKSGANAPSGLAWRAIGAVGNYMYGDKGLPEKESRGRHEGRGVGDALPRMVGLGSSGKSDDGWGEVRRVVIIGVHGWFPAKMLNSVIGEPTGTSVKFTTMMRQAVCKFFKDHGVDEDKLRLTIMPLEGEGTIDHRVDKLFKAYLSNPAWINDLRRADAIFLAAHSQGCIVTTHLISRLIAQGHIRSPLNQDARIRCEWAFGPIGVVPDSPKKRSPSGSHLLGSEGGYQKVAMLSMCGVHLGPLYSMSTSNVIQPYLQWFENAAARELFEFQDSAIAVSVAYQKALGMILENGVKMVMLASLNDQVVSDLIPVRHTLVKLSITRLVKGFQR